MLKLLRRVGNKTFMKKQKKVYIKLVGGDIVYPYNNQIILLECKIIGNLKNIIY